MARSQSGRTYYGIMASSTFTDLEEHRQALIRAIKGHQFFDIAMENDAAKLDDVIASSLQMVADAEAYICVLGEKYGQIPECHIRNPRQLSITELEFDEALRLDKPILLFLMGEKHDIQRHNIERDAGKQQKRDAFRERAKQMGNGSAVPRIYATFESLEDFAVKAGQSIGELRVRLDRDHNPATSVPPAPQTTANPIPAPPDFYPEPPYAGTHNFVGRDAELNLLSDWATPADPCPILLFDAIGGSGKSMLTWEWTTRHSPRLRPDWAGRLWYSFYERGAVMADFCRHALAYITRQPLESFNKLKTPELGSQLLHHLQRAPWLLVLDGLERVLVAYNRNDAAELSDEEAGNPTDQIAQRDPCAAIRPEDDDLLRSLATATPSKFLITSRLTPRVLLNPAGQEIPGVRRMPLRGLRPADAEALLRSCGVTGDSPAIQSYLQTNCDCHPLTTGFLAGPIVNYLPDIGNFDAWAADPEYGGQLTLADLNLVQRRNHILKAAIAGLPEKSRKLLSLLALLSEGIDGPTLQALNPHLPPEPEEVEVPSEPNNWSWMSEEEKRQEQEKYETALQQRKEYEKASEAWKRSPEHKAAQGHLDASIRDLKSRGLVQFDTLSKRYDLHPVVRGVAAGGLQPEEKDSYGQRVVDHFSARPHNPYDKAVTLDDVRDGIHIARTYIKMGQYQEACDAFKDDLANALFFNLEANAEILSLLTNFFSPDDWATPLRNISPRDASNLADYAGIALASLGEFNRSLVAHAASLEYPLHQEKWSMLCVRLRNLAWALFDQNSLVQRGRCVFLTLDLATLAGDEEDLFGSLLLRFQQLATIGRWEEAQSTWNRLNGMGRDWRRNIYRPGRAEELYSQFQSWRNELDAQHLGQAEHLSKEGNNRPSLRSLYRLRGEWHLRRGEWPLAAASLQEAVSMARSVGQPDAWAETFIALARYHLGTLTDPQDEAQRLGKLKQPAHRPLGELWLQLGDREKAKKHALAAYTWAWADGEPYVHRYELDQSRALLERLGAEIPQFPPYDPAKDEKFPWEDDLAAAIAKLRAEKEAESKARQAEANPDPPQVLKLKEDPL